MRRTHEYMLNRRGLRVTPGSIFSGQRCQMRRCFLAVNVEERRGEPDRADRDFHGGRRRGRFRAAAQCLRDRDDVIAAAQSQRRAALEFLDRRGEQALRLGDEFDQSDRRGLDLAQPFVQRLLDFPCELAQLGQADHAAAAFQRVISAANDGQRIDVVRRVQEQRKTGLDGGEHALRFLDVYGEQLRPFERGVAADLHCALRQRRRRGGRIGHCRARCGRLFAGLRRRRRFRAWHRHKQRAPRKTLEKKVQYLVGGRLPARLFVEVETKRSQALGQPFEILGKRRMVAAHATLDQFAAGGKHLVGAVQEQDIERAAHLVDERPRRGELGGRRVAARHGVDHLFDLLQVADDFAGDLAVYQRETGALRDVVAQRRRRLLVLAARPQRVEQPADHDRNLLADVRRQVGERVQHAFDQHERRAHLEHQRFALRRVRVRQLGRDQHHDLEQVADMVGAEVFRQVLEAHGLFAELRERVRLAARVFCPAILQRGQQRLHVVQYRLQPGQVELQHAVQPVCGQLAVDLIQGLQFADALGNGFGMRKRIQQIAHQRRGIGSAAIHPLAHEAVDPAHERLELRRPVGFGLRQRLDECGGDPPQRLRAGNLRGHLAQRFHGAVHLGQAVAVVARLQPREQAALIQRAVRSDELDEVRAAEHLRRGVRRRDGLHIREEQISLGHALLAQEFVQFPVNREELERHVQLAFGQLVQELAQRKHAAVDDRHRVIGEARAAILEALYRILEHFAEARGAVEAEHLQRAAYLAQVGRARGKLLRAAGARGGERQVFPYGSERNVDFALEPRQRAHRQVGLCDGALHQTHA